MDIIKIVGTRTTSFTAQNGDQVNGMNVFFTRADPKVTGVMTDKCFIPMDKLPTLSVQPGVGVEVRVLYNRYGKVDDFLPMPVQNEGKVAPLPGEKTKG